MSAAFEVLDHQPTPMGARTLRRRLEPTLQIDVYTGGYSTSTVYLAVS